MNDGTCDRSWEVDAYREGRLADHDAASFERHLRACRSCAELRTGNERLRDLASRVEDEAPDAMRLRRLRRRIMNDVALDRGAPSSRRWGTWMAAGAAALVLVAAAARWKGHAASPATTAIAPIMSGLPAGPPAEPPAPSVETEPQPPKWAGSLTPSEGSRWSRSREAEVERVRLEAGSLSIHVRPQLPGERFVVVLPDGDLEVRGTTFDVTVKGDKTAEIHVAEGVVELRIDGYPVRRLEAGGAWPASATPSKAPGRDDGAADYASALRSLGAGDNQGASTALRAFVAAHRDAPQIEDATFLEAVALARAGRIDAAGAAAEEHLARFPSSFHRKEALVLIDRAARARDAGH
jgi:hypothetical protein